MKLRQEPKKPEFNPVKSELRAEIDLNGYEIAAFRDMFVHYFKRRHDHSVTVTDNTILIQGRYEWVADLREITLFVESGRYDNGETSLRCPAIQTVSPDDQNRRMDEYKLKKLDYDKWYRDNKEEIQKELKRRELAQKTEKEKKARAIARKIEKLQKELEKTQ